MITYHIVFNKFSFKIYSVNCILNNIFYYEGKSLNLSKLSFIVIAYLDYTSIYIYKEIIFYITTHFKYCNY